MIFAKMFYLCQQHLKKFTIYFFKTQLNYNTSLISKKILCKHRKPFTSLDRGGRQKTETEIMEKSVFYTRATEKPVVEMQK
jgi:hypothetical protein